MKKLRVWNLTRLCEDGGASRPQSPSMPGVIHQHEGEGGTWGQNAWTDPPLPPYAKHGRSLYLSVHISSLSMGIKTQSVLRKLWGELNKIVPVKPLEECLVPVKCSINGYYYFYFQRNTTKVMAYTDYNLLSCSCSLLRNSAKAHPWSFYLLFLEFYLWIPCHSFVD